MINDEIISIEYYDEIDTIDISVDDTHMFFANGIYTHNSGFDTEFVEANQTGGSIKRVQKAHFFMSVGKTPEQKESNLASIRIIKARFAKDGQTFKDCTFNNDTMQIIIEDDRYPLRTKGIKKYDSEDIDKLDDMTGIYKENHNMGSLLKQINSVTINDTVNDTINDTVNDTVNDINYELPTPDKTHFNDIIEIKTEETISENKSQPIKYSENKIITDRIVEYENIFDDPDNPPPNNSWEY